jgi:hypothetical protein
VAKHGEQFVMIFTEFMDEPAWRAMSPHARWVYVSLKRRYNTKQGNAVYLSGRIASKEVGFNKDTIGKCYRELQYYGFIVEVTGAHLGVEGKGVAARWRLTEMHYHHEAPTRDYKKWCGEPFHEQKSPKFYRRKKTGSRPTASDTLSDGFGHPRPTASDTTPPNCPTASDTPAKKCPTASDISSYHLSGVRKRGKRKPAGKANGHAEHASPKPPAPPEIPNPSSDNDGTLAELLSDIDEIISKLN